jgi:hypothetical protein
MRKFFRIVLLLCFISSCLFIGLILGKVTLSTLDLPPKVTVEEPSNQIRLIIFVVNPQVEEAPTLLSIWSVIMYFGEPKSIVFIQLITSEESNFPDLESKIKFNDQNNPSAETIRYLEKIYGTHWEGSVILDNYAVQYLSAWLSKKEHILSPEQIFNPDNNVIDIEALCTQIEQITPNHIGVIEWTNLIPHHFRTDLPFERVMASWQQMEGNSPIQCELVHLEK